jgi:hypothetical protein
MPKATRFLAIKRGLAGQQFVREHAKAVNVAARVDVQAAHLSLFRADVSGVPMNCWKA